VTQMERKMAARAMLMRTMVLGRRISMGMNARAGCACRKTPTAWNDTFEGSFDDFAARVRPVCEPDGDRCGSQAKKSSPSIPAQHEPETGKYRRVYPPVPTFSSAGRDP